jgi:hypothetical protein
MLYLVTRIQAQITNLSKSLSTMELQQYTEIIFMKKLNLGNAYYHSIKNFHVPVSSLKHED